MHMHYLKIPWLGYIHWVNESKFLPIVARAKVKSGIKSYELEINLQDTLRMTSQMIDLITPKTAL